MGTLREEVVARLAADGDLDQEVAGLVEAALCGSDALEARLRGDDYEPPEPDAGAVQVPASAYLTSITVEGFRGVGPRTTLELTPGPGLTLVVGRNGSGKSSFAEGLEVLLTGENQRWSHRTAVWREGWRNLHAGNPCAVGATLALEGHPRPTTIERTWHTGDDITDGEATVQPHGKPVAPLDSLGWDPALEAFRPFLSYNELGSMLEEGPSKLYDALASILGLELLTEAGDRLRAARLTGKKVIENARGTAKRLAAELDEVDDPRARVAATAISSKDWDLDAIAEIVSAQPSTTEEGGLFALHELASLALTDEDRVLELADALRTTAAGLDELEGTDAGRARQLVAILQQSLDLHEAHGDTDCPVCGTEGVLNRKWRSQVEEQMEDLSSRAEGAETAHALAQQLERQARALITEVPAALDAAESIDLDATAAKDAWAAFAALSDTEDDLRALADGLEEHAGKVIETTQPLVAAASEELARREDIWRPYAESLASWLADAREAQGAAERAPNVERAEQWIKATTAAMRDERFAPIREQAQEHWNELSRGGSVELDDIRLEGAANQRRVQLDVTVDGVAGAALGVMSQGELHSLALSLFLPRAMLADSPFRFLVVDDPVQAMDPARVDGLALVLKGVSQSRQVVIFTHDDRLPEAVRRLQIDATIIEVTRRPNSVVELRPALDPVQGSLQDARVVAHTETLPPAVAQRVVPGLCRQAIEAACIEVVRRRRIGNGHDHSDVERTLTDARKLKQKMALALFDDAGRAGDVLTRINSAWGRSTGDDFISLDRGAHDAFKGDYMALVRDAERLAAKVRQLK